MRKYRNAHKEEVIRKIVVRKLKKVHMALHSETADYYIHYLIPIAISSVFAYLFVKAFVNWVIWKSGGTVNDFL